MKKYFSKFTIIFCFVTFIFGFTVGFLVQKSRTPSFPSGNMTGGRNSVSNNVNRPGNTQTSNLKQTMGEITKVDDSSITVKTPNGSSKIVLTSDSTTINKAATGTKDDLKVGASVSITGDSNTDGSITGKTININSAVKN